MKTPLTRTMLATLLCLSGAAASAQQNETMRHYFNEPASQWDIAALRIETRYEKGVYDWGTVGKPSLEYDWDTDTPYISISLDFATEFTAQDAEGTCKTIAKNRAGVMGNWFDRDFGHDGYGSENDKKQKEALKKQMEVQVWVLDTNFDRTDFLPILMWRQKTSPTGVHIGMVQCQNC